MLAKCLQSIGPTRQDRIGPDITVRYVVVDNAPSRRTRGVVAGVIPEAVYVAEPKRGLAEARNAALAAALDLGADWIAFIDDDEVAANDWLTMLYWEAMKWRADAVHGRVCYAWPHDAAAWRRKAPWASWATRDGVETPSAGSNNILFSTRIIRRNKLSFCTAYSKLGGEDVVFFRRMHDLGARIVFSTRPAVRETVPWSRITIAGFARKAHRNGAQKVHMDRVLHSRFKPKRYIRKAATRLVTGVCRVALVPFAALIGRAAPVLSSGVNDIAEALGMVRALRGNLPTYYAKTDGY
jgi:succinoglycan biosynthesis protein ExoM